jgi:hypothetical protein
MSALNVTIVSHISSLSTSLLQKLSAMRQGFTDRVENDVHNALQLIAQLASHSQEVAADVRANLSTVEAQQNATDRQSAEESHALEEKAGVLQDEAHAQITRLQQLLQGEFVSPCTYDCLAVFSAPPIREPKQMP